MERGINENIFVNLAPQDEIIKYFESLNAEYRVHFGRFLHNVHWLVKIHPSLTVKQV